MILVNAGRGAAIAAICALYVVCTTLPVATASTSVPASAAKSVKATASSDGDLPTIVSGGTDHTIKRWDSSGKLIDTLGTLDETVNVLRVVSNGFLVSGGADGLMKTWSLTDARETQSLPASKNAITAIAVSPDGLYLVVGGSDGLLSVWNRLTGKRLSELQAHGNSVNALQITSDGVLLISGSGDKTIRVWKVVHAAKRSETDRLEYKSNIAAHDDSVMAIDLASADGMLATVSADGWLKTWRLDGGLVGRMKVCDRGVACVAFSPDGNTIATGDNDGKVRLWNAHTSTAMPALFLHDRDKPVYAVAWTANSKVLVSGGADKTIRYWNVETGQKLKTITAHDGAVKTLVLVQ